MQPVRTAVLGHALHNHPIVLPCCAGGQTSCSTSCDSVYQQTCNAGACYIAGHSVRSVKVANLVHCAGRAMELGRECLQLWGYKRVDELIWVKTNQLQRLIRTGRTGHWLNHSKEHCLVGVKGSPQINRNLDCDVLVAEVQ